MPPKVILSGPYGPGSPLLAPEGKKTAAVAVPPARTTTAPANEAVAATAAAAAAAPAPAPAKKTRRNRRRHGKRGKRGAAGSAKKTTAKSPSSSASTVASAYNYRGNANMPDKAEIMSDLLDLISLNEEIGDEEEAARLLKIYQSFVKSMSEPDTVNLGKVEE
jgi:hypothetical protein